MHLPLPIVMLSAFALIAPALAVDAKDKGKDKSKDAKKEQKSDDRRGGRDDGGNHHSGDGNGKITICHIPPGNPSARRTLTVGESAWSGHSGHGDHRGACGTGGNHDGGRFGRLDTNNDGFITAGEWDGDRASFLRLDRNNDGPHHERRVLAPLTAAERSRARPARGPARPDRLPPRGRRTRVRRNPRDATSPTPSARP